jgi:hypothetical protein
MLGTLKKIQTAKKWLEGNTVAGVGTSIVSLGSVVAMVSLSEYLQTTSLTPVDQRDVQAAALIVLSAAGGAAWNWVKGKAIKKVEETNIQANEADSLKA